MRNIITHNNYDPCNQLGVSSSETVLPVCYSHLFFIAEIKCLDLPLTDYEGFLC